MSSTTIYQVKVYDIATDQLVLSRRMATEEGAAIMGGSIVKDSARVVDLTDLEAGEEWTAIDFKPNGFPKKIP